jgi:hypothetical protein
MYKWPVLGPIISDSRFVASSRETELLVGDKSDSGIDCTVRRSAYGLRNVGSISLCVCVCVCVRERAWGGGGGGGRFPINTQKRTDERMDGHSRIILRE